ncbi:MAG: 2-C-methyl-D-erythritol 4-phosphate cytidylyltransferase, partial [Bdellovibrionia bacterium]
MNKFAIVVAGGSGTRMGSKLPKQFLLINNKPVLWYSVRAFLDCYEDLWVILVLPVDYIDAGTDVVNTLAGKERVLITGGGRTRFHSVQNGLEHV